MLKINTLKVYGLTSATTFLNLLWGAIHPVSLTMRALSHIDERISVQAITEKESLSYKMRGPHQRRNGRAKNPKLEALLIFIPKCHSVLYNDNSTTYVRDYGTTIESMLYRDLMDCGYRRITWLCIPPVWHPNLVLIKANDTGKYILDNERKDGNKNLIGYNGLFADRKSGIMSALEFIHSFRKTKDSPYPKYTDQEAVDALYKIKEVKDTLASDLIFKFEEKETINNILNAILY
ncbi:hypothetical protein H8356DRAFT_1422913 [Neocallimastix lanati (nom. inval.)]|nr:hypothetical protein H8356DRAFT_1422913 [Neocallimastix sp. JGI-2020a]